MSNPSVTEVASEMLTDPNQDGTPIRVMGLPTAVALLTTFYGAVLANMVLSPLAVKLERNALDASNLDV